MKLPDQKSIDERLPAPMIAILFWMLAGLLVLLAMAQAKDRWLEVGIAGIGAVGQVAIAVFVWRLSIRQFEFTKHSAIEANKMALHDRRVALLSEYIVWSNDNVTPKADFQLLELTAISLKSRSLFSTAIVDLLGNLATLGAKRKAAFNAVRLATNEANPLDFMEASRLQVEANQAFFDAHVVIMTEMTMSLEKLVRP